MNQLQQPYVLKTVNSDTQNEADKKILVFDLGSETFEVTILKINQSREHYYNILSTKGDKF